MISVMKVLIVLSKVLLVFTHALNNGDNSINEENINIESDYINAGDHIGQDDIMFRKFEEEILFGTMKIPSEDAIKNVKKHWKLPVPYVIHSSLSSEAKEKIKKGFEEYNKKTCITFREKQKGDKDYIMFIKSVGCWSYVGKSGGKQYLSLGNGCYTLRKVCHEIMHALGFFHEQSRPDRDDYVIVNYQNIKKGKEKNFAKQNKNIVTTLNHDYDYKSIMHYLSKSFSKNGKKTIERINGGNEEFGNNNQGLSVIDAKQLNAMYCPTKVPTSTPTKVPSVPTASLSYTNMPSSGSTEPPITSSTSTENPTSYTSTDGTTAFTYEYTEPYDSNVSQQVSNNQEGGWIDESIDNIENIMRDIETYIK